MVGWRFGLHGAGMAVPLLAAVAASLLMASWLRRWATHALPRATDAAFLSSFQCPDDRVKEVITARADIARVVGIPASRLLPDALLGELTAATTWFGSGALALDELQHRINDRTGRDARDVALMTVRQVVMLLTDLDA
ncbi:hypothetical protein AMOR_49940 [Anaeromyxobacter oryzae]|uniref:Uncharacterized protein n=2 Tax=Anaeromyxobacter oryzae TaxID=2918170 RepID=A0ABM7X2I9_9BACT|nr:hypothetical protein AMOR_49940 [Anaeromyxobacter oryzae]